MILTNEHNLPETIVNLVKPRPNPHHPDSRVSVSNLLQAPRQAILGRRYYDEITDDVMDRVWLLFGNFAHFVFEKNAPVGAVVEEKLEVEFNGCTVVGIADIKENDNIDDYKTTTVWADILDKGKSWKQQVNLYACLWRLQGHIIISARVIVFYRDWRMAESYRYGKDYPKPMQVINIPLMNFGDQKEWLTDLTNVWKSNIAKNDDDLDFCTPDQQYESETVYAVWEKVKFENRTKTSKCKSKCESVEKAELYIKNQMLSDAKKKKSKLIEYTIEERKGIKKNCEWYCKLRPFCNQYKLESQGD